MADINWADFKSSGQATRGETGNDEWADFGGFECASPSSHQFGNSSASQALPWATAFSTQSQPNTMAGSTPVFPIQPTGSPTITKQGVAGSTGVFLAPSTAFPTATEQIGTAAVFANQPAIFPSAQNSDNIQTQVSVQSLPTATPTNKLFISPTTEITTQSSPVLQADPSYMNSVQAPVAQRNNPSVFPVADPTENGPSFAGTAVNDIGKLTEVQEQLETSNIKLAEHENKLQESEKKLSLAEREKLRLEESMEAMKKKCCEMEDLSKEQNLGIEKQKQKYDELQEKQKEQLKELREAGQESFALIVEEYKELSRTAVAQQQDINEKHLKQLLEEERGKFIEFVNQQNENIKLSINEEQEKSSKKLEETLEEQKTKHQAELNDCLNEERQRGEEAVARAVEEERERAKDFVQESLRNQKKEFDVFIEEQKKTFQEMLEEDRKETVKQIEKAVKDEQERAKNAVEEALAEERQNSRETVATSKEKTKEEMMRYVDEKQKADDAVRLRNYQSMDLFLQGVQTQLNTLMNNGDVNQAST